MWMCCWFYPLLTSLSLNLLTAGVAYIRVLFFISTLSTPFNMLKIKCDMNQQDLKIVDLHFDKSE